MYEIEQPETASVKEYSRCIENSKKVRWTIEEVLKGRQFDFSKKFLPDGLTKIGEISFLNHDEKKLLSQIQARTYMNMFGCVERFISAKVYDLSKDYWLGDQTCLEALIRFSDEEVKHQDLFRQLDKMIEDGQAQGYKFLSDSNEIGKVVLSKSDWAVLALTFHIEIFTQSHYKETIEVDDNLDNLSKDVLKYHWLEESQHAVIDSLEWEKLDDTLADSDRDSCVNDLIELILAVNDIIFAQAVEDSHYFFACLEKELSKEEKEKVQQTVIKAYQYQYIVSGAQHPTFGKRLTAKVNDSQMNKIQTALKPIIDNCQ